MGLLHPGALAYLALIPALVLAYLARERPARATVSSVLAFRALRGFRRERFGGWPRLDWKFFIEAAILALAALAMAGPFTWRKSNPIAIVIDNSAAMQALTPTGQTRFEAARAKLDAMLAAEDASGEISIYLTAPHPSLAAPPYASLGAARRAIAELSPADAPNDQATISSFLSELASETRFAKVIFAGASAIAAPVPAKIHAIAVGDSVANAAIGSFSLRREAFGADALHARLTLANFSPERKNFTVTITGDGRELAHAPAALGPSETAALEFPALASAHVYKAELKPDDALALDNIAYATAGAIKTVSVLFVSPSPADAAGLETIPGVEIKTRTPGDFTPSDLGGADLAIFEYAAPKELPNANTMLVMPPPGDPVFDFAATAAPMIKIAGWSETDPLTDSVNFRLLNLRAGEYFGTHSWMSSAIGGDDGALMLKGERGGHRFVAVGFNPFPYLGRRNLPMSILTLNAMGYLAGLGMSGAGFRTGEPWLVPAGVEAIVPPSGRKIAVVPGTLFTEVSQQGVYELIGSHGETSPRAVNLSNLAVSDLENTPALRVEGGSGIPEPVMERHALDNYLIAAIIALCALEALIVYRRRRIPLETAS
ncbi:MAG TPA: VWA domain-containing protein [Candidatus Binataceae bacterium]|nr:VWA domain-containing protein [Candidatus Binataceae bacterium]